MTLNQDGIVKKKRIDSDVIAKYALMAIASMTVLVLFFIILFILGNSFGAMTDPVAGLWEFITGGTWRPSQGNYGAVPLIVGTILVTAGSIAFAVPVGIGAAIYLAEVSNTKARNILKPVVELFAGIPSVVYGFFGLVVMVPMLGDLFEGQMPTGFGWITGSLLLGIMALPTIISVSEDAIRAVPRSYREASLAIGATKWETTIKVVVPAAISGIAAAIILGIGRAIGETMAVMMVTGNAAIMPEPLWNIFSFVRTITATLALEMPEVSAGGLHYSALFFLALILMVMVLFVSLAARYIVKRTQAKFNPKADAKPDMMDKIVAMMPGSVMSRMPLIKEIMMVALIFVVIFMGASLFVDGILSLVIAFALTIGVKIAGRLSTAIKRASRQKIAHGCLTLIVVFVCIILVIMIGEIVIGALPALSWEFLTAFPKNGGEAGGIFPAIIGTLELMAGTALIALPIGIFAGVYLAEYARPGRVTDMIRQAIDMLNGTPSIVFGLFGMAALVVFLGWGYCLIAGCVVLALMILPVVIRTTEEAVMSVPHELREASRALGATKWQTTMKVVLPSAFGSIITGAILGLGRAAGETAPIMFTAVVLTQYSLSDSIMEPVMALPYHLYYLATEGRADPSMQHATALVLLVIVLSMFIAASIMRERSNKKNKW